MLGQGDVTTPLSASSSQRLPRSLEGYEPNQIVRVVSQIGKKLKLLKFQKICEEQVLSVKSHREIPNPTEDEEQLSSYELGILIKLIGDNTNILALCNNKKKTIISAFTDDFNYHDKAFKRMSSIPKES